MISYFISYSKLSNSSGRKACLIKGSFETKDLTGLSQGRPSPTQPKRAQVQSTYQYSYMINDDEKYIINGNKTCQKVTKYQLNLQF